MWRNPALAPEEAVEKVSRRDKLVALARMLPFACIIFVSVGLIMADFATASEAAALGVVAALLESFYYGKMKPRDYLQAAGESAVLSAVILIIIATAILLGQVLAFTGMVQELGNAISALKENRWLLFFCLMLLPFVLCIFVDQIAIMMILIPIYDPMIKTLGFDPVWFWMQFLIIMVAGSITPPFGYIIFALKAAVPEMSLTDLYPPAWLFTCVTLFGVAVFTVFPEIITFLPRLMK